MRHSFQSIRAESIIETIVAVTVIVLSVAAALSLIRTSLEGNEIVGEKEVAIQLALEGLDALQNMRDTNYLLYADAADECWSAYNVNDAEQCSQAVHQLKEGTEYFFEAQTDNPPYWNWQLNHADSPLDGYLDLYSVDIGNGSFVNLYAQTGVTDNDFELEKNNVFRRTMTLVFEDPDGDGTPDAYDATVTVTWVQRDSRPSISLTRTIAHVF